MVVIASGRQTGRTTKLIKACAEAEQRGEVSYIVCHSHPEAYRIAGQAKKMGLNIGFPITYDEFLKRQYSPHVNLYIDNVDMLVRYMSTAPIKAITVTTK